VTKPQQIDFIISNPGHHAAMMKPVMARLVEQGGYRCRLLSLCEFRGLESPVEFFKDLPAIEFTRIVPFHFRSPSSGGKQSDGSRLRWRRVLARRISWELLLKKQMRRFFKMQPALVVLPNDAAFPYDLIVEQLKSAGIPFLLRQEGIRFPLPGSEEGDKYGLGGAAAVAAWGEGSAAYFRSRGVPANTIHATGSPRFDTLPEMDFSAEARRLKEKLGLDENTLLFLSNPIDDQGFCTTQGKLDLAGRFLGTILPLFDDSRFRLVIKLHPRESVSAFQAVVEEVMVGNGRKTDQVIVMGSGPLYPLFALSKAAIVLASTVGLEALMMDVPLGVLEIPGTGFVYDYVDQGAAVGLTWKRPMLDQVCELLTGKVCDKQSVQDYISYSLSTIGEAAETVTDLIIRIVADS
jgi:hypothetical protein